MMFSHLRAGYWAAVLPDSRSPPGVALQSDRHPSDTDCHRLHSSGQQFVSEFSSIITTTVHVQLSFLVPLIKPFLHVANSFSHNLLRHSF